MNQSNTNDLPLNGYRILDLTRVWSGPLASRILADMGAEVIAISGRITIARETPPQRAVESMGVYPDNQVGKRPWNRSALVNDLGRNKKGLTLELNTEAGVTVFKELVKKSDVVMENFSPRVMVNFGLDYPVLREVNPEIIMCSMPGYGLSGPYKDYVSFGANLECFSGLASLMGYAKGRSYLSGTPYPDPAAAVHAAGAILTALFCRLQSGEGQHIDLAQSESVSCLIGEEVLGYALTGKEPHPIGNRHRSFAPQGIYRTKGADNWIAIAISTDEEWHALVNVMKNIPQLNSNRFASNQNRKKHHDEIDTLIQTWTSTKTRKEAMDELQKNGVPAGAVRNAENLVSDPQLSERGFFWEIDHAEVGQKKYCGLPIKMSAVPQWPKNPAPCLGEHNAEILRRVLGFSDSEIQALEEKGVIGTEPLD